MSVFFHFTFFTLSFDLNWFNQLYKVKTKTLEIKWCHTQNSHETADALLAAGPRLLSSCVQTCCRSRAPVYSAVLVRVCRLSRKRL